MILHGDGYQAWCVTYILMEKKVKVGSSRCSFDSLMLVDLNEITL